MDVTKCALTTIDNPYDPFDQFTEWMLYDEEKGYHSTSYLGRIARTCCKTQANEYEWRLKTMAEIQEVMEDGNSNSD